VTPDEAAALAILEDQPQSPERDLLMYLIRNVCAVGCGDDAGCFYCARERQQIKTFIALKTASL
jgi:hypothetical protein